MSPPPHEDAAIIPSGTITFLYRHRKQYTNARIAPRCDGGCGASAYADAAFKKVGYRRAVGDRENRERLTRVLDANLKPQDGSRLTGQSAALTAEAAVTPAFQVWHARKPSDERTTERRAGARCSYRCSVHLARIAALLALVACSNPVPYALSSDDAQRFAAGIVRMNAPSRGAPVILGLRDCEVFSAVYHGDKIVDWKSVLDPKVEGYFKFMTGCLSQSLTYDGHSARAKLQRIPLGAGGGGLVTFVSTDGTHWNPLP